MRRGFGELPVVSTDLLCMCYCTTCCFSCLRHLGCHAAAQMDGTKSAALMDAIALTKPPVHMYTVVHPNNDYSPCRVLIHGLQLSIWSTKVNCAPPLVPHPAPQATVHSAVEAAAMIVGYTSDRGTHIQHLLVRSAKNNILV